MNKTNKKNSRPRATSGKKPPHRSANTPAKMAEALLRAWLKPGATLLTQVESQPSRGYDDEGKKLLASTTHKEFSLFERAPNLGGGTFVVRSEKVERAYWKAIYRIKGSPDSEWGGAETRARIEWAHAIGYLERFTRQKFEFGGVPVAKRLGETLGKAILQCREAFEKTQDSSNPDVYVDRVTSMFKDAILANLRAAALVKDMRLNTTVHPVAVLICEAGGYFHYSRKTPSKSYLRQRLDQIGCGVDHNGQRSKDYRGKWRERFVTAGLSKLPE